MRSPHDGNGQMVSPEFDLGKAELSVDWIPRPDKEFRAARGRWVDFVRGSNLLTGAERQIGLAIAQVHINRRPGHRWFNWAWPSHQTLADETGLSRRTVVSALKQLAQLGLIKIAYQGGRKGRGGRTNRYTLMLNHLASLEAQDTLGGGRKGVKKPRAFQSDDDCKTDERCEIRGQKVRNPEQEDVKEFPTTLINTHQNNSVMQPPTSSAPVDKEQLSNGSKKEADTVTSGDHTALAKCVGNGDLEVGYEQLFKLSTGDLDAYALRLRKDPSAATEIRHEVKTRSSAAGLQ